MEIQGKKLQLILDTGMPAHGAFIFGSSRIDKLAIEYVGQAEVNGLGGDGNTILADLAMGINLRFPGLDSLQ